VVGPEEGLIGRSKSANLSRNWPDLSFEEQKLSLTSSMIKVSSWGGTSELGLHPVEGYQEGRAALSKRGMNDST